MFAVTCVTCRSTLVTTRRIRDPEVQQMEDHLRDRHPDLEFDPPSPLGWILEHYWVTRSEG